MVSAYDKFFIAVLILAANGVRSRYGIDFGLDEQMANDLISGIAAAFVWLTPNKASSK